MSLAHRDYPITMLIGERQPHFIYFRPVRRRLRRLVPEIPDRALQCVHVIDVAHLSESSRAPQGLRKINRFHRITLLRLTVWPISLAIDANHRKRISLENANGRCVGGSCTR